MTHEGKIEIDGEEYARLMRENAKQRECITELQRDMTNMQERHRLDRVGGILTGKAIEMAVMRGDIEITPFKKEHINPASIDLTLGRYYTMYQPLLLNACYDVKAEIPSHRRTIPDEGLILTPGELYLMHTEERVATKHFVSVLDGKSSIGRLGICVHLTAGYGDVGFDGQYTLEMTSVFRMRIYAGMKIAQMRFHTVAGERTSYQNTGKYVGEFASGPVPSMAWKQFR